MELEYVELEYDIKNSCKIFLFGLLEMVFYILKIIIK